MFLEANDDWKNASRPPRRRTPILQDAPARKDGVMWFAGIDWADRHHDLVVIDETGRKVAQLHVEHTPEGLAKLVSCLRGIAPLDHIACMVETRHGLLITALLEAGLALSPINPKTVDRKRSGSFAKTDLIRALQTHGQSWCDGRDTRPRRSTAVSPHDGPWLAALSRQGLAA